MTNKDHELVRSSREAVARLDEMLVRLRMLEKCSRSQCAASRQAMEQSLKAAKQLGPFP